MTQAAMFPEPSADPEMEPPRTQSPGQSSRARKASALARLTGKDLINVGIYTAIYGLAIVAVGMLGYIPVFIPLLAALVPILGGIPFVLFLTKVRSPGMLLLMGLLLGLIMLVTGMGYWTILTGLVAGALAEVTWRSGGYRGVNRAVLTSSVFSIWVIGNFLPFYIGRNAYLSQLAGRFGTDYAQTLAGYMPGWLLPVLLIVSIVFGLLGGLLGRAVCAKHFVRAGLA